MSRPLDHHHQPIFYLTGWCGPDGKVTRYWRPNGRKVVASPIAPKNTGYEPRLYSLDGYPKDQEQVIEETFFAPVVDEPASRALKVLVAGGDPSKLTNELAEAWTRFLMAARARSPDVVAMMQTLGRRNIVEALLRDPHQYEAVRRADDPPTLLKLAERTCKPRLDNHGKIILPGLIQHPRYAKIILRMNWMTLHLPEATQQEFLTSDYPCVLTHGGLDDPHCVVAFPLHPRSAFFATGDNESKGGLLSLDPGTIVEQLNDGVVRQAERYVYGRTDADLAFVESRLRAPEAMR
jgi:Protein of unknown function (DUF4238)